MLSSHTQTQTHTHKIIMRLDRSVNQRYGGDHIATRKCIKLTYITWTYKMLYVDYMFGAITLLTAIVDSFWNSSLWTNFLVIHPLSLSADWVMLLASNMWNTAKVIECHFWNRLQRLGSFPCSVWWSQLSCCELPCGEDWNWLSITASEESAPLVQHVRCTESCQQPNKWAWKQTHPLSSL